MVVLSEIKKKQQLVLNYWLLPDEISYYIISYYNQVDLSSQGPSEGMSDIREKR